MQSAPPVRARGTGGRGWSAIQAALYAASAASFFGWACGWIDVATPWKLLLVSWPAVVGMLWFWRRRAARTDTLLAWDGQRWQVDGNPGRLDVMIDLERWLLLRFAPDGGARARWPAISAAEAGVAWHGLRTAVHAREPLAATEAVATK